MSDRILKLAQFIKENEFMRMSTFLTPNICNDEMCKVYEEDGLTLLWCPHWHYLELFGATNLEVKYLDDNCILNVGW